MKIGNSPWDFPTSVGERFVHFPAQNTQGVWDYRRKRLCGAPARVATCHPVQLLHFGADHPMWCVTCAKELTRRIRLAAGL
jgi:hypothetical protein